MSAAGLNIGISQLKYIFGVTVHGEMTCNYQLFHYYLHHGVQQGSK